MRWGAGGWELELASSEEMHCPEHLGYNLKKLISRPVTYFGAIFTECLPCAGPALGWLLDLQWWLTQKWDVLRGVHYLPWDTDPEEMQMVMCSFKPWRGLKNRSIRVTMGRRSKLSQGWVVREALSKEATLTWPESWREGSFLKGVWEEQFWKGDAFVQSSNLEHSWHT